MGQAKKRMLWISIGIMIIAAAGIVVYFAVFNRENPPLAKNEVRIGTAATFDVEVASTTVEKARGLSYRTGLAENAGMLFLFDAPAIQNFWMKDMNFPLDIVWIGPGTNGEEVLGFAQNAEPQPGAPPWGLTIYTSPDGTDKVLEVNAGTVAKDGIKIHDAVQIGPITD